MPTDKSKTSDKIETKDLIDGKFMVGQLIARGAFGAIYVGINVTTRQVVAIKRESVKDDNHSLAVEQQFYQMLQNKKGFPSVFFFGEFNDHRVLVLDLLGPNLESVFEKCKRKFTLKSILFIVLQLLKRFETIHGLKILYRDVKPENFVLGVKTNTVFVIDFGLAKFYTGPDHKHLPFQPVGDLVGTARYMSINAHLRMEQGRRDDLEALGYVFAYFLRGNLPWSGLDAPTSIESHKLVCEAKRTTKDDDLVAGHPRQFLYYLRYVRSLAFDADPNYEWMRDIFKRLFHESKVKDDGLYDWNG